VASAQRWRQWRARSEGGGGGSCKRGAATAAAAAWRAASGSGVAGASGSSGSNSAAYLFLFPNGATPPGLKPAVMVWYITVVSETGGDGPVHHQRIKSNAPQNRR